MANKLCIRGHSTALFSTWYFVEQYGLMFDCGDGCVAELRQKSRKVRHLFVTHPDRDHLTGLLQFHQLNARDGLRIYYPRDAHSFVHLEQFCRKFDPHLEPAQWIPLGAGDEVAIGDRMVVRAVENEHIATDNGIVKSLSYFVDEVVRKLHARLAHLSGVEIAAIRQREGDQAITSIQRRTKLAYSGDTPVCLDGRYDGVENEHIATDNGIVKSLSYFVDEVVRKLHARLAHLSGVEIAAIRQRDGDQAITSIQRRTKLAYSGDTPVCLDGRYDGVETLIHESTFLTEAELQPNAARYNRHSSLDQVLNMAAEANLPCLVLGHFSSRYDHDQIRAAVEQERQQRGYQGDVQLVLPGEHAELTVG